MARTLEELTKWLETDEGKAHWKAILEQDEIEQQQEEKRKERYFSWMDNKRNTNFDEFKELVEKVVAKYDSKEYINRAYKSGHYPERTLLFLFWEYAHKHGEQYEEGYTDEFVSDSVIFCDWIVSRADGCGDSVIEISEYTKEKKQEHAHNLFLKFYKLYQLLDTEELNDDDLRYLKDASGQICIDCMCELRHRDLD